MNGWAMLVLAIAAVNPARVRLLLGSHSAGVRSRATLGGALVASLVAILLAGAAHPAIDALDVAPETFRIASGMVVTLSGVVLVAMPLARPEALSGARKDAVVPVAYPILLWPGAVLTWMVLGVDEGVWAVAGASLGAHLVAVLFSGVPEGRRSGWLAAARLVACVVIVLGAAMVIDGVREV